VGKILQKLLVFYKISLYFSLPKIRKNPVSKPFSAILLGLSFSRGRGIRTLTIRPINRHFKPFFFSFGVILG
jgi:hypothetical protein